MKFFRFLLPICLLISFTAYTQTDTAFWFVAPSVSVNGSNNGDRPIELKVTTYDEAATVSISQPANAGLPTQTLVIPANSTEAVDLTTWIDIIENKPANSVLNYGLKITATTKISVYYEVVSGLNQPYQTGPEAYVLKGINALGQNFIIPGQNVLANSQDLTPYGYNAFDIVATQDNTTVTISPASNIVGHNVGVAYNIILNKGQTYSAVAQSQAASEHLEGSTVIADKPIAITVSDDVLDSAPYFTVSWGRDLAGDQIVPIDVLGNQYVAVKGQLGTPGDQLFITATQNNTEISKNGNLLTTINAGQTFQTGFSTDAVYIASSHPVAVWQLSGIVAEMGATILPTLTCSGSSAVSYTRSTDGDLYINLITESGNQGNFFINGNPAVFTATDFNPVPGTNGAWLYATKLLPISTYPQGSVIKLINTSGLFQMGVLDGTDYEGASYAYFSNYGNESVTVAYTNNCVADDLQLSATGSPGATYHWMGPNNFSSNSANATINNVDTSHSGMYILSYTSDCGHILDTLNIEIYPNPTVNLGNDTSLCLGDTLTLTAGADNYNYQWSNGASTSSIPVDQTGIYWVNVTVPNSNCMARDTITITFTTTPEVNIGRDTVFCLIDEYVLAPDNINPETIYEWNDGTTNPTLSINETGLYWLTATSPPGCESSDSIFVEFRDVATIVVTPRDTTICENTAIQLIATGGITYSWIPGNYLNNPGISNPVSSPTSSIVYIVTGTDSYGCSGSDEVRIEVIPAPEVSISSDKSFIDCGSARMVSLTATGANNYNWTSPALLSNSTGARINAYPSESSFFYVSGTSDQGCIGTDSILIEVGGDAIIFIPNAFSPNSDGKNEEFKINYSCNFTLVAFKIYNRWGQEVFSTADINSGWDGSYNGGDADLGTYYYLITGKNNTNSKTQNFRGDVTLVQ